MSAECRMQNHAPRFALHAPRFTLHVLLVALIATLTLSTASAQSAISIADRGVDIEFPERITFRAHVESSAAIDQVVLEYGVEKLTCGEVTAKAFPDFEPGQSVDVSWTWEMLKSGSEPPGATIWYRWRVADTAGNESVSDEQRVTWLDQARRWQSISREMLTLHWYDGSRAFAEDLLNSAVESLARLGETTGVEPQSPIDMYIYAETADLRDAVLYEPGWTGGQAFSDQDILIIGISPDQIEWGKDTEAHELTHVLVGRLTFSCLGDVPTWLNEGIAVYGEGDLDPVSGRTLQDAIAGDTLISVRALSGSFSEHPDKAGLSYAQSFSLVNFLIRDFGQGRLLQLFGNLRDGMPIEDALNDVYGFGLDGLEDRWRESIGAQPRQTGGLLPTPTLMPTPVPTYRPLGGAPGAPTPGATPASTPAQIEPASPSVAPSQAQGTPAVPTPSDAPQNPTPTVIALIILVVGLAAITIWMRRKRSL